MNDLQDILLGLILISNVVIIYGSTRLYKLQSTRINDFKNHIQDIKAANFGTVSDMVEPIKEYIKLLEGIRKSERTIIDEKSAIKVLENILSISKDNSKNIEILLKTRLTNTEAFSKLTAYLDKDA